MANAWTDGDIVFSPSKESIGSSVRSRRNTRVSNAWAGEGTAFSSSKESNASSRENTRVGIERCRDLNKARLSSSLSGKVNLLSNDKTVDFIVKKDRGDADVDKRKTAQRDHVEEIRSTHPPWVENPDGEAENATMNWEMMREEKLIEMRNSSTYQFLMLVCSFTDENVDKYFNNPSEDSHEHSHAINSTGEVRAGACQSANKGARVNQEDSHTIMMKQVRLHNWYIDTPWASGVLYLSAAMFGALNEAYICIVQRWQHLAGVKMSMFTDINSDSPGIRVMFAKLTAMNIRSSSILSAKRYSLDALYKRVNLEKRRLIVYWKHIKVNHDGTLSFSHTRQTGNRTGYADWDAGTSVGRSMLGFADTLDAQVGLYNAIQSNPRRYS